MKRGTSYSDKRREIAVTKRELAKELTKTQREKLDEYTKLFNQLIEIAGDDEFSAGFSLGVKRMLAAFYDTNAEVKM